MSRRRFQRRIRPATGSRRLRVEALESRRLLAALPLGVTPLDTGEFMLGTVTVTPVFFESNGVIDPQTQNWSPEEIDQVLAKISEGVNWWRDTLDSLNTVHTLEFIIDDTFAVNPVSTPYEPIDRPSTDFNLYVGDFIIAQGYGDANSIEEGVRRFNHDQRLRFGTDWAFTIFVADSSDDADGLFAAGLSFAAAFAYPGGLFLVTPSTRPASTIAHETGHIFWARDEYPGAASWTDRRGYYDAQNLNAADNPTPGFQQQISIMRGGVPLMMAYEQNVSPASTLAMVGWRDSNGNGVFDLADVPLRLDGIGHFDPATSMYRFRAEASAVPLLNRNSSGPQSDITLNRISQLQYRLDEGPWLVAAEPDAQVTSFDLSFSIASPFSTIQWRVIDLKTGVTSPILEGSRTLPAIAPSSISGISFLDTNGDGSRSLQEAMLTNVEVVIRHADQRPLLRGAVDAKAFASGELPATLAGVSIAADGIIYGTQVASFESSIAGGQRLLHGFDLQRGRWEERWSRRVAFTASFEQPVGEVEIDAIGIGPASYARIEAYDASGQLIARSTSPAIAAGAKSTIRVTDSLGRIASVRVFGHAETSIGLQSLRFGSSDRVVVDASGAWRFNNLPDGNYLVELRPERVIHQFAMPAYEVEVVAGTSSLVVAAANRVNSNRHHASLAEDVNGDGRVSASDALAVINDMARFGSRILTPDDPSPFNVDVNNDGFVSALDALLVINYLGRQDRAAGEFVAVDDPSIEGGSPFSGASETWEPRPPLWSQMVDSAGVSFLGESIDREGADNTRQRDWGQSSRVGGSWRLTEIGSPEHRQGPSQIEPRALAAETPAAGEEDSKTRDFLFELLEPTDGTDDPRTMVFLRRLPSQR